MKKILVLIFALFYTTAQAQNIISIGKSVTTSKTHSTTTNNAITDNNLATAWNAGTYATQWISIDLETPSTIKSVKLLPCQSPNGSTTHQIHTSTDMKNWTLAEEFTLYSKSEEWIIRNFSTPLTKVRGIKITTTKSPSWICWFEIQVIGGNTNSTVNSQVTVNTDKNSTKTKYEKPQDYDFNEVTFYGSKDIHSTSYRNQRDMECLKFAQSLVQNTGNPDAVGKVGDPTLLWYAAYNDRLETVKFLISKGANVNAKADNGNTPLNAAVSGYGAGGGAEIAKLLISKGANVNAKDKNYGNTPLHHAAESFGSNGYGANPCLEILLNNGAKILNNNNGESPLYKAVWGDEMDNVRFLVRNGCNINQQDNDGRTPLYRAVRKSRDGSNYNMIELLLKLGAKPTIKDNEGTTPIFIATDNGNYIIVELLKKYR
jgi:ankyrin repeat protein